jgi:ATP-dependent Clp endopeptidase proteolytic subunit ClpP
MKKWYNIVDAGAGVAEISIFEDIGLWGVSAKQFAEDFNAIRDRETIHLYINCYGGDVMDGMAIYNILSTVRDKLKVEVIGIAASMASVIALAGCELIMDEGTYFVIHNPWTVAGGDAEQLRKDAGKLDKIKGEMLNIYGSHSIIPLEELAKLLDEETWMTADEAVKNGFASSVNKQSKAVALVRNPADKGFNKVPKNLIRETITFRNMTVREVEDALRDVGLSRSEAKEAASRLVKSEVEEARVEKIEERDARKSDGVEFLNYLKSII